MTATIRELLRGPSFPPRLPQFDVEGAPDGPVALFHCWLAAAVSDQVLGPQAMTLATADATGRVSSRVLICHDVDERAGWYFASDSASGKGRDLAANPRAAASFYWPQHGRQIRVSGTVASAGAEASAADFRGRSPVSRAAGLAGPMSEALASLPELDAAFARAEQRAEADPDLVAPRWTVYVLVAATVEFWQADSRRRHVRLQYERTPGGWTRQLLWP